MQDAYLGVDVGTSSLKTIVVDSRGVVLARLTRPYSSSTPATGGSEQNPDDWLNALHASVIAIDAEVRGRVRAIGVAGQVPTLVLVDEAGNPVRPAMTWQDARATREATELAERLGNVSTELGTDIPWSATQLPAKLAWLRDNEPAAVTRARWILAPKDFVNLHLTGEVATDAWSSKGICDVRDGLPAARILDAVGWRAEACPPTRAPWEPVGTLTAGAAARLGLPRGIPVATGWSDALAAVLAVGAFDEPSGFVLTGTSEIVGVSSASATDARGLYTVPHTIAPRPLIYGPTQSSGASVSWIAGMFGLSVTAALDLAGTARGTLPVFVPYISGERAPLWNPDVRGTFLGVAAEHGPAHLIRSVLRGVALSARHVLDIAASAAEEDIAVLNIGGIGIESPLWKELRRRSLGLPLRLHGETNSSALGAAMLAAMVNGAGATDLASLRRPPLEIVPTEEDLRAGDDDYREYRRASSIAIDWSRT